MVSAPVGRGSLARRAVLLVLGLALVAGAAYLVFHVLPAGMQVTEGPATTVSERVSYWTPEEGRQEAIRSRSARIVEVSDGLALKERLGAAHSPRGRSFQLAINASGLVEGEPGVRVRFPTTPLFGEAPRKVHLGVPWTTDDGTAIGAIDTFHREGTVEEDGIRLVRYKAREPSQFFVTDGTIWYRAAQRTVLVEPVTGDVVDYRTHEVLWREPEPQPFVPHRVHELTTEKRKVWEATVEPTEASAQALLQQAAAARAEHLEDLLVVGLPVLGAGEVLLWGALAARPRRLVTPGWRADR